MDKKELKEMLRDLVNNPKIYSDAYEDLMKISTEISKEMVFEESNPKNRVLNLLLLNAYKSMHSYFTLIEHNHVHDAKIISRKIVEIFIRIEYLSKTNSFEYYLRERVRDQAQLLYALVNSRPVKYLVNTKLWDKRHQIINDCKQLYTDQTNKQYKVIPSVEEMAKETGLLIFYKETYGSLSKFVHCNMSIENFFLLQSDNELFYDNQPIDKQSNTKQNIELTVYTYYKILTKYCEEFKFNHLDDFNKKHFLFTSLDLFTGSPISNVDITLGILNGLLETDFKKEEDDSKVEVKFFNEDPSMFKESWTKLERLILQKEKELNSD